MIMDKENLFSGDQAVTATALSANIVSLGAGDAGPSERLSLVVNAGTAFTGAGTMKVEVLTSDELNTAGDALNGAVTVASYPVTNDQLLAGGKLAAARLPHGMKKYARLNYAVTGTLADGKITAGLVWEPQS